MTFPSPGRSLRSLLVVSALLSFALPAHAQLGGLIKKKIDKVTAAGGPVVFDDVILEITQERLERLTAGLRLARQFAQGPEGRAAMEAKIAPLDARQVAIYEKQVDAINAWDEKRRAHENCLDSAFSELRDKAGEQMMSRAMSDPQMIRRMMELSQAATAAQEKGDTATLRKITEEMDKLKAPTKADSLEAAKQCGELATPAIIKEWLGLNKQIDALRQQLQKSEDESRAKVESVSGMNPRQSGMFCERIKIFIQRLQQKQKQVGFSDKEQQVLANLAQAIKDLEELCP